MGNSNYSNNILYTYYKHALQLQIKQNINCYDSQKNSIAQEISFPLKFNNKKGIKKLFMSESKYIESDNFIYEKYDDSYIKSFFIKRIVKETLQYIEIIIKNELINKNNDESKKYLNKKIADLYKELIIPNIHFILILILTSIENGDKIKFNHNIDITKLSSVLLYPFIWLTPYGKHRAKYEKEFKKNYFKSEIERLNMGNLIYKIKIKNIVDSNILSNDNEYSNNSTKIYNFIKCSESQTFGEKYYIKFLNLLNNYSNDFPEDIEISIFENLKETNEYGKQNLLLIKEIMNDLINDDESKKGFLALVR